MKLSIKAAVKDENWFRKRPFQNMLYMLITADGIPERSDFIF